jgi:RNA polymerase sigma-70 factor (ECF subfamily)
MSEEPRRKGFVDPEDEAGLVTAAQGGDEAAFAEIVRRHQRAVYRVAYGLTRNAADADDLAQETFVRAWQALGRFRVGEPLFPWLSRIAINLAYSLFRRRKRRPEAALEPMLEAGQQWEAEGEDPVEATAASEHRGLLESAFGELTAEHQAILTLRVMQDQSYEEIAKTLEIPIGTVMSRLSRARAELKRRLEARTGGEPAPAATTTKDRKR